MTGNKLRPQQTPYSWRILAALSCIRFLTTISAVRAAAAGEPLFRQTCNSNAQCLHGGTCRYTETGQGTFLQCQCANGYSGSRCEHYCPLQCQHGGICRSTDKDKALKGKTTNKNNQNDFVCRCKGYFTGWLCETPYENCNEGVRCYNYGTCHETETNNGDHHLIIRSCECPPEWTGPSCETRAVHVSSALEEDHVIESSSGRTVLWVVLALFGVVGGVLSAMTHRSKGRFRRWRYNAVTRRAVAKFRGHAWLGNKKEKKKNYAKFHDDAEELSDNKYLDDSSFDNDNNLRDDVSDESSKILCDAPEYRNVI